MRDMNLTTPSLLPQSSSSANWYFAVAIPVPMRQLFDYLVPASLVPTVAAAPLDFIGRRAQLKFGNRELIGIITSCHQQPSINPDKIRAIDSLLDPKPILTSEAIATCSWAANYYQAPLGEVLQSSIPQQLRQGKLAPQRKAWRHTTEGLGLPNDALKRSPKQQLTHQHLLANRWLADDELDTHDIPRSALKALQAKGLIEDFNLDKDKINSLHKPNEEPIQLLKQAPLPLNSEQQIAVDAIRYHKYATYLLEGATGSGKTEVYLQLTARVLQAGRQVLVLVPEIGLTPQTLGRFQQRFNCEIAELHSNVSEAKRTSGWQAARDGIARIVIGTRLASLTPMQDLGLVIIDEEHDLSFKQQDGFRYSARDLLIYRASQLEIPVILGSATPSLESLNNAIRGRSEHVRLTKRAGKSVPPRVKLLDLKGKQLNAGLCPEALVALQQTIAQGQQALVFINRRGYAPALLCHHCGWSAECRNCDSKMTLHRHPPHIHCHHCDAQRPIPRECPECRMRELEPQGQGTEQTEIWLQSQFPDIPVHRIDRDSTRGKSAFEHRLEEIQGGDPMILIGTQMLAKGHHLPNLALVIIADADQGLFSSDFRGLERMAQLIIQVAGRAGRAETKGTVLIQSHNPEHPALELLLTRGYHRFARELLNERQTCNQPPFSYLAVFRAESKRAENAQEFLSLVARACAKHTKPSPQMQYLGPVPARMERLNDRFRYQFEVRAQTRAKLQTLLRKVIFELDQHALSRRTRWSIDVDALEL
ncbi:primosomal protein N' [Teredinibacter waterburyi]|uniref:primosomal protein N' n=1 Tax=Teredinibacter waterburyi TaxID=1500538 RepID=UPI001FEC705E|nr:primosomal protein N' [Teredinibacter waterburyi]